MGHIDLKNGKIQSREIYMFYCIGRNSYIFLIGLIKILYMMISLQQKLSMIDLNKMPSEHCILVIRYCDTKKILNIIVAYQVIFHQSKFRAVTFYFLWCNMTKKNEPFKKHPKSNFSFIYLSSHNKRKTRKTAQLLFLNSWTWCLRWDSLASIYKPNIGKIFALL